MAHTIRLVIEGRERLDRFVRNFPLYVRRSLEVYTRAVVDASIERLKKYPPRPQGSTYVRTYLLKNSFESRQSRLGRWVLSNTAPYSGWVIGPEQARHMQHWRRAQEVASEQSIRQLPVLVRELSNVAKGL